MKLSIIIPVFNERKTLKRALNRVLKQNIGELEKEIILVDDGSTDGSKEIIFELAKKFPNQVQVCSYSVNQGKGYAVRKGLELASGDVLLIQDADLEYHPKYYPALLKPILKGKTQVVYGSRLKKLEFKLFGLNRTPLPLHYLGNRFLANLTNILFSSNLTDMETGYKVFTRQVSNVISLTSNRFELEPEITAKILKRGFKINEVPIQTKPRSYQEGKKITWKDGVLALYTLLKIRFRE